MRLFMFDMFLSVFFLILPLVEIALAICALIEAIFIYLSISFIFILN